MVRAAIAVVGVFVVGGVALRQEQRYEFAVEAAEYWHQQALQKEQCPEPPLPPGTFRID